MSFVSLHHVVLKVEELHLVVEVDDLLYSPFPFTFIMINGNISSSSEHFRAPFTIHYPGRTWACNVYPSTPVLQVPRRGSRRPRARSDISAVFTIAAQSSSHHGPVSWLDIPALSTTFSRQLQQHQQQHSDPSEMSSHCIPKFIMVEIDTTVFILTYIYIIILQFLVQSFRAPFTKYFPPTFYRYFLVPL